MQDYGYDEGRRSVGKIALIALLVVAALVGLYFLGWFLREQAVNRTSAINNDSFARQTALANEVTDLHTQITDLEVTAAGDLTAEQKTLVLTNRAALVDNLCSKYGQMTDTVTVASDIHAFAAKEC